MVRMVRSLGVSTTPAGLLSRNRESWVATSGLSTIGSRLSSVLPSERTVLSGVFTARM